jgi:SEL1 protein
MAVAFHKHIAERGTWALNEGGLILPGDQDRETASTAPPGSTDASTSSAWRELKEDGELNFGGMGLGTAGVGEERMIRWSIESERGEEVAQNNLAFVLDQGTIHSLSPSLTSSHKFGKTNLPYVSITNHQTIPRPA